MRPVRKDSVSTVGGGSGCLSHLPRACYPTLHPQARLVPAPPPSSMAAAAAPARPWAPALLQRPAPAAQHRRRALLPPPCAGLMGGLYDMAAAVNAEALARKEGSLVGAERGIKPLTAVALSLLEQDGKAEACAEVLERQGCLGVRGVLSEETAAVLREFILEENARCQADVEAGRVEFDSRFGGVNCRCVQPTLGDAAMRHVRLAPWLIRGKGWVLRVRLISSRETDVGQSRLDEWLVCSQ